MASVSLSGWFPNWNLVYNRHGSAKPVYAGALGGEAPIPGGGSLAGSYAGLEPGMNFQLARKNVPVGQELVDGYNLLTAKELEGKKWGKVYRNAGDLKSYGVTETPENLGAGTVAVIEDAASKKALERVVRVPKQLQEKIWRHNAAVEQLAPKLASPSWYRTPETRALWQKLSQDILPGVGLQKVTEFWQPASSSVGAKSSPKGFFLTGINPSGWVGGF